MDAQQSYERFQQTLNSVQKLQTELKSHAGDLLERATDIAASVMPKQQIFRTVEQAVSRNESNESSSSSRIGGGSGGWSGGSGSERG